MENENIKNLIGNEAQKKIKELAEGQICHFATYKSEFNIITRPMSALSVDEEGNIWFMSHKLSSKNQQISENNTVDLLFSHPSKQEYLAIKGKAYTIIDDIKARELWSPFFNAWFQDGIDDNNISLIRVMPTDGYYWDTKYGSVVSFLKIAASVITGKTDDAGIEGQLKVD